MTENIRTVPGANAISSIDGEELPAGAEPTHPEATEAFREDVEIRPVAEEPTGLVLDVE